VLWYFLNLNKNDLRREKTGFKTCVIMVLKNNTGMESNEN